MKILMTSIFVDDPIKAHDYYTKILGFESKQFAVNAHSNNWSVTIRSTGIHPKTFSMNLSSSELNNYLNKHYSVDSLS